MVDYDSQDDFQVKSVMIDEAGHEANVVGLGSGFWLWYSAILVGLVASIALMIMGIGRREVLTNDVAAKV